MSGALRSFTPFLTTVVDASARAARPDLVLAPALPQLSTPATVGPGHAVGHAELPTCRLLARVADLAMLLQCYPPCLFLLLALRNSPCRCSCPPPGWVSWSTLVCEAWHAPLQTRPARRCTGARCGWAHEACVGRFSSVWECHRGFSPDGGRLGVNVSTVRPVCQPGSRGSSSSACCGQCPAARCLWHRKPSCSL